MNVKRSISYYKFLLINPVCFTFFVVGFLSGCKGDSLPAGVERVVCQPTNLKSLTEKIAEIEVVRLQEADSLLLDDHVRLVQRDSSLYLIDRFGEEEKGIYRFSLDGRFQGKIGTKGNAPEEYPDLSEVAVDEMTDEVTVFSEPYLTLTRYSKEGIFKSKKSVDIPMAGVWKFPFCYWVVSGFGKHPEPPYLLRLDTALHVTDTVFLPANPHFKKAAAAFPMFASDGEEAKFSQFFYPVIYKVSADSVRPAIFFDFGNDYPTWEEIMQGDSKKLTQGNYVVVTNYYESPDYISVAVGEAKGKKGVNAYYGWKDKSSERWDWIDATASSKLKWYMTQMCGFAKDGRAMYFFFGNELENLPDDARRLVKNPEELEHINPEVDMFVLLCRFRQD